MTVQVLNFSSDLGLPSVKFSRSRKLPRLLVSWPMVCLTVICIINSAQAQTFQYSRGWTNGKRSGATGSSASSPIGLVDTENGYLNPEITDFGIIPGHVQMNLSPQARLRTLDYNQYLYRKLGLGNTGNLNTRKQPLWFGTILGMDSTDPAASSQSVSGTSNSSPSGGATNDF